MGFKRFVVLLSGLIAALVLLRCTPLPATSPGGQMPAAQSARPADLTAEYAALAAAGGRTFTLDPGKSTVRIHVFRGGRAGRVGHNHVLAAPEFAGFFFLPTAGASNGRFDLEFRLDQLEIDNSASRSALGSAFSSVPSAADIDGTRRHMLGADNMQADQFPLVRVRSLRITGESPKFAANVQIEMHGQAREIWIPLDVQGLPDHLSVAGSFVLRQSDFGVKPYSVLGGLLAVEDEVVIEFKLSGA
jgi:polyisoprenoid-binding protein YceI